ncbi:hypothetical protein C9424_06700, partial [Arthrobacter sp. H-02-3]
RFLFTPTPPHPIATGPAGSVMCISARGGAGQGLGLALSRQLARRRGGDVRVLDPGSPGGPGAVFVATLPGTTEPTGKDTDV